MDFGYFRKQMLQQHVQRTHTAGFTHRSQTPEFKPSALWFWPFSVTRSTSAWIFSQMQDSSHPSWWWRDWDKQYSFLSQVAELLHGKLHGGKEKAGFILSPILFSENIHVFRRGKVKSSTSMSPFSFPSPCWPCAGCVLPTWSASCDGKSREPTCHPFHPNWCFLQELAPTLKTCQGFHWDRVNFLHWGLYDAVFWILFIYFFFMKTTLITHQPFSYCRAAALLYNIPASHAALPVRSWEGIQPGQLTPKGYFITYHALLSNESWVKGGGKGTFRLMAFVFPRNQYTWQALPSEKWLNICLPMGSGEFLVFFACTHSFDFT